MSDKIIVLGKEFNTEEERRTYFRNQLRKQLPELKKMEGFPIGEDDDIINLSDPPYYTACPNPWLNDFIAEWEEEKIVLEKEGKYNPNFEVDAPYARDISEGKNNPIYMAHSYHTKVPHPAIMRYILHYTQPGDIIFDGFAGTGMTGVAASLCENPESLLKYKIEKDVKNSNWGRRYAICSDLSPIASFIASRYNKKMNLPADLLKLDSEIKQLEKTFKEFYKTSHSDGRKGIINYIIYSDVFLCKNCNNDIIYFKHAVNKNRTKILNEFKCQNCFISLKKSDLERAQSTKIINGEVLKTAVTVPVIINYSIDGKRYEKEPCTEDIELIESIENKFSSLVFPSDKLPKGVNTAQPLKSHGITHVNQFFSKRALVILNQLSNDNDLLFLLTSSMWNSSNLYRWRTSGKGGIMNGVLYVASIHQENNVFNVLKNKLRDLNKAFKTKTSLNIVSTHSATNNPIKDKSVDYIFTDPPFGGNIMYSELSYLWESWLKVKTEITKEAIENKVQNKTLFDYQSLMLKCFNEYHRIIKPGGWMTVEFSNTSSAVWNGIQTALQNSGFVIANVSAIDKKQGSFKAVTTVTAVKQDLIISCYKPTSKFDDKFRHNQNSGVGIWTFIEEHLHHLPIHLVKENATTAIIERSPKILFDRLLAFYIQKGLPVPIGASKFQKGLGERFIERDSMFFTSEQAHEYDKKKKSVPKFLQLKLFVGNEQDSIYWLRDLLVKEPMTDQDIRPLWMQEVASNMRKWDILPEMRTILEENFLKDDEGRWYLPDTENEADLEKLRNKRLLKQFEIYKKEANNKKTKKIKEVRVEALRAGFKQCYQDKDFTTIVLIGDKIPNNLLMEDEVLLQFYDIAVGRV